MGSGAIEPDFLFASQSCALISCGSSIPCKRTPSSFSFFAELNASQALAFTELSTWSGERMFWASSGILFCEGIAWQMLARPRATSCRHVLRCARPLRVIVQHEAEALERSGKIAVSHLPGIQQIIEVFKHLHWSARTEVGFQSSGH